MKVLTVAIPVYNTEKYLKRCFDSVLIGEILDDIEIVAVNDGSKDHSIDILKDYEGRYPGTVVVVDKENGGHGSAVNAALDHATGRYFRVLDSDDWFFSGDFVEMVRRLRSEKADVVISNYAKEFVYDGRTEDLVWKDLEDGVLYNFDTIDLDILHQEYFVMANTVYRTQVLRDSGLRLMEKTFYVDMQFNIIPITCVKTFTFYDLDIYRYFIGRPDQSMNLGNFIKNRKNHEKVMKFLVEFYTERAEGLTQNKRAYIQLILYYMLTTHYYIHCYYPDKGSRELYDDIRAFDRYLLETNPELYELMNKLGQIRYNRKTGFRFVRISPRFFRNLIQRVGDLRRKRG